MTDVREIEGAVNEIAALMRSRATMYGLLGRMFEREVDEAFLGQLRGMRYPQNSDSPDINEAFRQLYAFMRHAREDVLDVLGVDFARTFLGSGTMNGNAAFPYESVYTSEHALLMQEARDQVLAVYRASGMGKHPDWSDPEDHIALELDFMRELCERTARAVEADDDSAAERLVAVQYSFLVLHLLRWAPRLCLDVERFCSTGFYAAAARLTAAFLSDEQTLLEDIAQASGIDLEAALEAARAADAAVDAEMAEEAAKDHLVPNVVVTMDDERGMIVEPLAPEDAAEPLFLPVRRTPDAPVSERS